MKSLPAFGGGRLSAGQACARGTRNTHLIPALLLLAVTFAAYQPLWHAGFIWDDDSFLTNNPVIQGAHGLYRIWFTASTPDYFPLTSSVLWLEWRIWGNHPLGYHLVNVLLHAMSAVLLWRILRRLQMPGAILAAAVFAVHPVNVESVAWITEGKNTLAMVFYLTSLLFYVRVEDQHVAGPPSSKLHARSTLFYSLSLLAFACALLSKTAVVPLPFVLLALAWWRRGKVEWQDVQRTIPFFAIAAALGLVTVWFQSHRAIAQDVVRTDDFWSRLAGAGWAVWFYLYKAVLPVNLAFIYPRWNITPVSLWSYVPLALWVTALVLCWRLRRQWSRATFFALAYFTLLLLPVLGFVNIYFMRYSLVADHWQYFAIIGPIALAGAGVARGACVLRVLDSPPTRHATRNTNASLPFSMLIVLALGLLTWKQCRAYVSEEALWVATLRLNPECWVAHGNLADILAHEGRGDQAITEYRTALRLHPDYAPGHNNLGIALGRKGQTDEAIAELQRAVQLDPGYASAHNNLGNLLLAGGRAAEAMTHYREALRIRPADAIAHLNLGVALQKTGQSAEAIAEYQQALVLRPGEPDALIDLAWLLATCRQAELRDGRKALDLAQEAVARTAGNSPAALHSLAAALAETGQFSEARASAERAIVLARNGGQNEMAERFSGELKRYEAGLPAREE
ncbi:MAG TPA: tetratricopeptide repeat protein [Candidatus Acidoferrum sp.]|nr:tetratricopeptide repeat protein [Candidatus Acidoferrum sp.]